MLKMTSGHAKRNVLKQRAAIISGNIPSATPDPIEAQSTNINLEKKLQSQSSKAQSLSNQSAAIQKIANQIGLRQDKNMYSREKNLKMKIENLEKLLEHGVISKEEMTIQLKGFMRTEIN
jgi:hypothetical protein